MPPFISKHAAFLINANSLSNHGKQHLVVPTHRSQKPNWSRAQIRNTSPLAATKYHRIQIGTSPCLNENMNQIGTMLLLFFAFQDIAIAKLFLVETAKSEDEQVLRYTSKILFNEWSLTDLCSGWSLSYLWVIFEWSDKSMTKVFLIFNKF